MAQLSCICLTLGQIHFITLCLLIQQERVKSTRNPRGRFCSTLPFWSSLLVAISQTPQQSSYLTRNKMHLFDSIDFLYFTTGFFCPLGLLWMSLFLLSLHYTGSFYNNSITKLWLVPILPERNLQFLTQNELVPELGKITLSQSSHIFSVMVTLKRCQSSPFFSPYNFWCLLIQSCWRALWPGNMSI